MNHVVVVAALAIAATAAAQPAPDLRPELELHSTLGALSISPSGDLWFTNKVGYAFRSQNGGRSWREVEITKRKLNPPVSFRGDSLDGIAFFDARHAFAWGYIGERTDVVYVTDDGGATWKEVHTDHTMWVYDAQARSDGNAWLVGSEGDVMRSTDYGLTWTALNLPFGQKERTMSVSFTSKARGAVGSMDKGAVALTNDGGTTWQPFDAAGRDAVVKGCAHDHDQRVTRVRLTDDRLFVEQCGGVFVSPLAEPRTWTRVTGDGKPLVTFDLTSDGKVVGVNEATDLVIGNERTGIRFPYGLTSIDVSGARIAVLDRSLKAVVYDGKSWVSSRLLGEGTATSWPIHHVERSEGDVLWGTSDYFLYRSTDGAKTWERLAEVPRHIEGFGRQADGDLLFWDEHGWVARWNEKTKQLSDVPVLSGLDVVGSFRRRDLWLLYGGRQYDTSRRVEVAQTFFTGQFAGSVDYGFVAASVDGGKTWRIVDKWDEGPQLAFLADDDRLTLVSWLGGIRQGKIGTMKTLIHGTDREHAPYVQYSQALDLLRPDRGTLVGWIHHLGPVAFETKDGGKSWKSLDDSARPPRTRLYRLYDGTWIGWVFPLKLQRWDGKAFHDFATLPGEVEALDVDSRGGLLALGEDGRVAVLDPGAKALRVLIDP